MLSSMEEFLSRDFMPNILLNLLPVFALEMALLDLVEWTERRSESMWLSGDVGKLFCEARGEAKRLPALLGGDVGETGP